MSCFRASLLQFVRPVKEHELPRCVPQLDEEIRSAAVHSPSLPLHARVADHSLRPEARKHSFVQPKTLCDQDCGFWQLMPNGPKSKELPSLKHFCSAKNGVSALFVVLNAGEHLAAFCEERHSLQCDLSS